MDRKSRKAHQDEARGLEEKQSRALGGAADRVSDQQEVAEVAKKLQGGTAEGQEAVRGRLEAAMAGLSADFTKHMEERDRTGEEIEQSRREDEVERDRHYADARSLADAAGAVKQSEVRRGLEEGRDASAEDAVFFSEQERRRERMQSEGDRLSKGLRAQMSKLERTLARLSGGSRAQLDAGAAGGAKILKPHKDDLTGLGYKAGFDAGAVGRSGNEVRKAGRDDSPGAEKNPHYDVIERTPDGDHFHHRIYQPDSKDDTT